MTGLIEDVRDALRQIRRRPTQALVAVAVLAIGLSAGIAAFTYVNGFSQPFPGVRSEGLVRLFGVEPDDPYTDLPFLDAMDYRQSGALEGLAVAQPFYAASVRLQNMTEVAFIEAVTGNFFPLAGVEVAEGRGLLERDDRLESEPVAVISYEWWQTLFGGEQAALGSTIYLNYRPFTVVGVAAPEFLGTTSEFRPDVWIPIAHFRDRYVSWDVAAENRDVLIARVYGRLASGEPRDRALTRLSAVARGLDETYPRQRGVRALRIEDATWIDPRAREDERATVTVMMGAALGLLLLVCANVANLLLAISASRRREIAVRAALGASPARLLRQSLITNVVLAAAAGMVGLLLARPLSGRIGGYFARPSVWADHVPRAAAIDFRVVTFALGLAVLTGVVAGLVPSLRASRPDLVATLKTDAGTALRRRRRFGAYRLPGPTDLLVSAQIGLSVVLLTVAGLVLRTLGSVERLDPGFPYETMIASHISTSSTDLEPSERGPFFQELSDRLANEPWVQRVAVVDNAIMGGQARAEFRVDGQDDPVTLAVSRVIPGFFDDFGVEVVAGRSFVLVDSASAPDVAIVNQTLASTYFGSGSALGRRVSWPLGEGAETRSFEIVGVSADFRAQDVLIEPEPTVFLSFPQHAWPTGSALHVTAAGDPEVAVTTLQRWLRDYEPYLAIVNVIPYAEVVRGSLYTQRMNAEMFSALAVLALVLAAVGVFSVLSLAVGQRTREIGIRMAIGAERRSIGRLMVGRALVPVGLGLGFGVGASLALSGLARGLLYGVEPTDPVTLAGGLAILLIAALAAAYLPARRAARVDPIQALRLER